MRDNQEKMWELANPVVSFIFVGPGFILFDLVIQPYEKLLIQLVGLGNNDKLENNLTKGHSRENIYVTSMTME